MKHCKLEKDDLIGFIDIDEQISDIELAKINEEYNKLVDRASKADEDDYKMWYNNEGYYPPFVAEAIEYVI